MSYSPWTAEGPYLPLAGILLAYTMKSMCVGSPQLVIALQLPFSLWSAAKAFTVLA